MLFQGNGGRTISPVMAIINLKDLRAALPRHARLIGLDPGTKTIGVALSDVTLMLASPYGVAGLTIAHPALHEAFVHIVEQANAEADNLAPTAAAQGFAG